MVLYFNNLTFKNGINLTVRRGVRWDLQRGRNVDISEVKKPENGRARILDTKVLRACDIDEIADNLHLEQDPECRTLGGLFKGMEKEYSGWRKEEIVTLVYFEIL